MIFQILNEGEVWDIVREMHWGGRHLRDQSMMLNWSAGQHEWPTSAAAKTSDHRENTSDDSLHILLEAFPSYTNITLKPHSDRNENETPNTDKSLSGIF